MVFIAMIASPIQYFYRPHPKDGVGNVFTGVSLVNGGGGGVAPSPVPGPVWKVPPSPIPSPV